MLLELFLYEEAHIAVVALTFGFVTYTIATTAAFKCGVITARSAIIIREFSVFLFILLFFGLLFFIGRRCIIWNWYVAKGG